eukprot:1157449-Pelagomonas_calceolata.AAC.4
MHQGAGGALAGKVAHGMPGIPCMQVWSVGQQCAVSACNMGLRVAVLLDGMGYHGPLDVHGGSVNTCFHAGREAMRIWTPSDEVLIPHLQSGEFEWRLPVLGTWIKWADPGGKPPCDWCAVRTLKPPPCCTVEPQACLSASPDHDRHVSGSLTGGWAALNHDGPD